MLRKVVVCSAVAAAAALASVAPATAAGPAPSGKQIITVTCADLGTLTVSVPRSENNNGAAQIVGQHGHFIAVSFTFTVTDVTTGTVLFSDTSTVGHGHAHPNQPTTTCSFVAFEAPASEVVEPGEELPPGVSPSDVLRGTGTAVVIPKL